MKKLKWIFIAFVAILIMSCEKYEEIPSPVVNTASGSIKMYLLANNGNGNKVMLDSSNVYIGKRFKDTADTYQDTNDLAIKAGNKLFYTVSLNSIKDLDKGNVPLTIQRSTYTNYIIRIIVKDVPYDIQNGSILKLVDQAATDIPGQVRVARIGVSGGGIFEYFWSKNDYIDLTERFSLVYEPVYAQ